MFLCFGGFEVPAFSDCAFNILNPFFSVRFSLKGGALCRVAFQSDFCFKALSTILCCAFCDIDFQILNFQLRQLKAIKINVFLGFAWKLFI